MEYSAVINLVKQCKGIIDSTDASRYLVKGASDFVTEVDTGISSFLKEALHQLYPDIGFFSEEEVGNLTDNCWILDPIDGTTNLIFGYRLSSVSLAHYLNGEVVFGVVYNPFTDEVFVAGKGQGAYLNSQKILHVSNRPMEKSLVEFGAGSTHKENTDVNFDIAKEIFRHCVDVRRICSSALTLCYIADGRIDGYFEKVLKPWDIAAGSLILSEAGGCITDYDGNPLQFAANTSVIASNKVIHQSIQDIISQYN